MAQDMGQLGVSTGELDRLQKVLGGVSEGTENTGEKAEDASIKIAKSAQNITNAILGTAYSIEDWEKDVTGAFDSVLNEFSSFVVDLATGADVTFEDMLKNMAKKMLEFATQILVLKPILEWFQSWLKGTYGIGQASGFGDLARVALGSIGRPIAMATGGVISEPVLGIGAKSKSSYLIGEAGPEVVKPMGQAQSSAGGGANNININISAVDSRSVTQLMRDNPQAITGPITEALASGDRGLTSAIRTGIS
jgi:phage-related minor tail protein